MKCAEAVCGRRLTGGSKRKGSDWWNEQVSAVVVEKKWVRKGECGMESYTTGASSLALGTKVLDLEISNRDLTPLKIEGLQNPVLLDIPRTLGKMGVNDFSDPVFVNATVAAVESVIPVVYSVVNISYNDSSLNIEITPEHDNHQLFIISSGQVVPTLQKHQWFTMIRDIPTKRGGTYDWFISSSEINATGRHFIGVGEFIPDFDVSLMEDPVGNNINRSVLQNVSVNYSLRTFSSGCYFFNKESKDWFADGLQVIYSDYNITRCTSNHLTSFGAGLFLPPNTIDFSFVFANMGFSDNITIYLTLILCSAIFILLLIYARYKDKKDIEKLGAAPLPDNKVQDKYLYEMLIFTGNLKGAQTDSTVQFVLSGTHEETDVRTLGDEKRKILRKDGTDAEYENTTPVPCMS
ncbi:hypothetical protein SK128_004764 [Halocaridina rubra]|uniref:PLAT domain-containing protein n=1 Tax=Halocaridina rubra TaxID=373956 RepID=A0AAN8WAE9_HALRR